MRFPPLVDCDIERKAVDIERKAIDIERKTMDGGRPQPGCAHGGAGRVPTWAAP